MTTAENKSWQCTFHIHRTHKLLSGENNVYLKTNPLKLVKQETLLGQLHLHSTQHTVESSGGENDK